MLNKFTIQKNGYLKFHFLMYSKKKKKKNIMLIPPYL